MSLAIIPGAEPFSADGGPHGAVVLHGFTGNCQSVRGLAEAFAAAGFAVECPLLPGHGTTVADMDLTGWSDWSAACERAFGVLSRRVERVVVAGQSMGATLAAWLASRHPEIAGIICVNPIVEPSPPMQELVKAGIDAGEELIPGIGADIADPDVVENAYPGTPLRPLLSLYDAIADLQAGLGAITCPVLLFTSRQDHVVPSSNSDHLAAAVQGPVERVVLDRSYHVALLDYDRGEIESRAIDFALKVTAS